MTLAIYFVVAIPIDPNKSATMENKVLSPLHYACWFNAPEAVSTLLDNNANVESCAVFGQKPLHYAVTRASVELVKVRITAFLRTFCCTMLRCPSGHLNERTNE